MSKCTACGGAKGRFGEHRFWFPCKACNGTGNKPQDEVIREAFDILWGDSYHDETQLNSELDPKREFDVFKSGYKSASNRRESRIEQQNRVNKSLHNEISDRENKIKELEDRIESMNKTIDIITRMSFECVELNMNNYDEDQVAEINSAMTHIFEICYNWKEKPNE